jgi:hypothetical protein
MLSAIVEESASRECSRSVIPFSIARGFSHDNRLILTAEIVLLLVPYALHSFRGKVL